ncbi:MAG: hypothetical protein MUC92_07070 [Fimbriimonadaceae bacterium]|jgi:hypothetical protein|nr:hypothetical protein [Fimbriimonadaceae bacterium]
MRLFSDDSWWNQPIPDDPFVYEESQVWLQKLQAFQNHGMHMNLHEWTIPVYFVDESVPRVSIQKRFELEPDVFRFMQWAKGDHPSGHGPGISEGVPIPEGAVHDHQEDAHLCIIHKETGQAWDMWAARQLEDGSWCSCSACTYDSRGSGLLDSPAYRPVLGESIHLYGPSRAAGVPIPAGLIFRHEIEAGEIHHKLAFAGEYVGYQKHVFPPAIWTDGWFRDGFPEGSVIQLDPNLDLDLFGLTEPAKVVARALQVYGAAVVDYGTGATVYAEYNTEESWADLLVESSLHSIPFTHYRFLRLGEERVGGDDPSYHVAFGEKFQEQEKNSP